MIIQISIKQMSKAYHIFAFILILNSIYLSSEQTLIITHPPKLIEIFEGMPVSIRLSPIGVKPISGILHGQIKIAEPSSACSEVSSVNQIQDKDESDDIFFMADDTKCLESVKAKNIVNAGAYVALIKQNINNTLHDKDINQVHIPVAEVNPKQYETIQDFIKANPQESVSCNIYFGGNQSKKKIQMQLWISPTQKDAYNFILQLKSFILNQPDVISFEPRFVLHSQTSQKQYIGCLSSGRYCPPEIQYEGKSQGEKIVSQGLRELIISDIQIKDWFSYIYYFVNKCLTSEDLWENQNSQLCSEAAMINSGISSERVIKEYKSSFLGSRPEVDRNIYLEEERQDYVLQKIKSHPVLLINKRSYATKEALNVKIQICKMIHPDPSKQTSECQKITKPPFFTTGEIFIGVGILIGTMVLIMVIYKIIIHRKMKEQMKGEVDQTLKQYYRYMQTFEQPNPTGIGKVALVENKVETNQLGSVQLSDFKATGDSKQEQQK